MNSIKYESSADTRTKDVDSESLITYKYARPAVVVPMLAMIPAYTLMAWAISRASGVRGVFYVIGSAYIVAANIRALLRLTETVTLTDDGIRLRSMLRTTYIPWSRVTSVKERASLLEARYLRIESEGKDHISVAYWLNDYADLYHRVTKHASSRRHGQ